MNENDKVTSTPIWRQPRLVHQNNINSSTGELDCIVRNNVLRTIKTSRNNQHGEHTYSSGLFHECPGPITRLFWRCYTWSLLSVSICRGFNQPSTSSATSTGTGTWSSPGSDTWPTASAVRTTRGTPGHGECPSGTVRNKYGHRRRDTSKTRLYQFPTESLHLQVLSRFGKPL